ncbi:transcription factor domain-containing protein [Aspergillus saccharolyticus JOP 1030-1]|uniref:Putative Zn(II)2Cys6 transcription factor n=1 Tax=Aspergillus saccharolyticus JOP 1030-1 TaxID=1450539 RepID=A0A318ZCF7_9EURO|nr:putative Zn(II)2Cys6 transcription factor [Aspergillus saccharolyticus JOP 1030-1]PYH43994.1 putative Zn(II)2Cys6 transcription factor [Aspergillus saccharolyticus JOP 1030-1]
MSNARMESLRATPKNAAKSCTECRRRKVRCVRIPDDALECRQCQERRVVCIAQTASSRQRQTQRLPSRLRITQLEAQVSQLTKTLGNLERKLRHDESLTHSKGIGDHNFDTTHLDGEDSEGDSSATDLIDAEEPAHLRSLFQNPWLSVDMDRRTRQQQERKAKACAHLLEVARPALQKLIPSWEEAKNITMHTYDWLQLLELILPQPFAAKSQCELMGNYVEVSQPNVDVIRLATWLLEVAITALQVSQRPTIPAYDNRVMQKQLAFSHAVSDAVETTILIHDRVVGTLEGLGMALHFARLQIGYGNFQKAWVRLRHIVALAELTGLPKTVQLFRLKGSSAQASNDILARKAQLWESICGVDRILGMMMNIRPDTLRYRQTTSTELVVDGAVQPRVYLSQLAGIAARIHELEDMNVTHEPDIKPSTLALEIAREAGELASRTPASWWVHNKIENLRADHIIQLVHHYVVMRAHLPLALRQDCGTEYLYNRLACMDESTSVVERYLFVRRRLHSGIFISRILDLQAFTATVILLLMSHSWPCMKRYSIQIDRGQLQTTVSQVIELLREKSKDKASTDFAEHGMHTLCALKELLSREDLGAGSQELTLNAPLLGKIHIRRNMASACPEANVQSFREMSASPSSSGSQAQAFPSGQEQTPTYAETHVYDNMPLATDWHWTNLSWVVEESATNNLFEDPLPLVNFDQATLGSDLL